MIVLDASVMIAVLDRADAHSSAAQGVFRSRARDQIVAHRLTVAETLVQPTRAGRGAQVVSRLDELGVESLDVLDDPSALAELRANTGLSMPDCCVLLAAVREHAELATFDARLAGAARGLGVNVVGR